MIPGYIPGVVIYMIGGNPQSVSKMLFTIGPDFSELSRLPKWISDGVRDCFQNNPIISRKDTRLRLDQIPNEKRGFWKGRREWGYEKQLESGYPQYSSYQQKRGACSSCTSSFTSYSSSATNFLTEEGPATLGLGRSIFSHYMA